MSKINFLESNKKITATHVQKFSAFVKLTSTKRMLSDPDHINWYITSPAFSSGHAARTRTGLCTCWSRERGMVKLGGSQFES